MYIDKRPSERYKNHKDPKKRVMVKYVYEDHERARALALFDKIIETYAYDLNFYLTCKQVTEDLGAEPEGRLEAKRYLWMHKKSREFGRSADGTTSQTPFEFIEGCSRQLRRRFPQENRYRDLVEFQHRKANKIIEELTGRPLLNFSSKGAWTPQTVKHDTSWENDGSAYHENNGYCPEITGKYARETKENFTEAKSLLESVLISDLTVNEKVDQLISLTNGQITRLEALDFVVGRA